MNSADDFWLNMSRLADSFADCGSTAAERATRAMWQFESMPHVAQREIISGLRSLAYQLPDLYVIAAARSNRAGDINRDAAVRVDAG